MTSVFSPEEIDQFIGEGYVILRRGFLPSDSWLPFEKILSGLLQKSLVSDFLYSSTSGYSGDFHRLCARLIESPHEDEWRYSDLATFGMSEPKG